MPAQDPIEQRIAEIEARRGVKSYAGHPQDIPWLIAQLREAREEAVKLRIAVIPTRMHSDESWRRRTAELEAALRKAEARLSTYDDCFEQFDVETLAALVDKYENKLNKAEQERDALLEPPNIEAWKTLVAYAYEMGGDGARQIQAITSEYVRIRQERDTALIEAKVVESLRNEIPALKHERDEARQIASRAHTRIQQLEEAESDD